MSKSITKYFRVVPITLWLAYIVLTFSTSIESVNARLEAIQLSREYSVGGFPLFYNLAAYSSFFDDIILLIIAILGHRYLSRITD